MRCVCLIGKIRGMTEQTSRPDGEHMYVDDVLPPGGSTPTPFDEFVNALRAWLVDCDYSFDEVSSDSKSAIFGLTVDGQDISLMANITGAI